MSVTPAEEIRFSQATDPGMPNELVGLHDTQIELIQVYKGENSQVEHNGKSFNAPEEPGRYYYSAIVKYTGDIKGEASFAFALIVK